MLKLFKKDRELGDIKYSDVELFSALEGMSLRKTHIPTLTLQNLIMADDGIKLTKQDIQKAKSNDKDKLHYIGETYYHLRKYTKAFPWIYKAAIQHHGRAQYRLGNMYQKGYGVSGDYKIAIKWYKQAASKDIPEAMNIIGSLYRIGCGVSESDRLAAKWFMKAAKYENADSMNNLAHLYECGYGVSKDILKAVKWYTRAANQGSPEAQYHLGLIYESQDKIKDLQKAVDWYQKASGYKYKDAAEKMMALNEKGHYAKEEKKENKVQVTDGHNSANNIPNSSSKIVKQTIRMAEGKIKISQDTYERESLEEKIQNVMKSKTGSKNKVPQNNNDSMDGYADLNYGFDTNCADPNFDSDDNYQDLNYDLSDNEDLGKR